MLLRQLARPAWEALLSWPLARGVGPLAAPWPVGEGRIAVRGYAAGSSGEDAPPHLKEQLRKLYKLVHPDLFHGYPTEQETNGKSFQLLQEYLEATREPPSGPAKLYSFDFYLHPAREEGVEGKEGSEGEGAGGGGGGGEEVLRRVQVALPPPARAPGGAPSSGRMSRQAQSGLGKLLAACGLWDEFRVGAANPGDVGLFEYIRAAQEELREHQMRQNSTEQQLAFARTALRVGRGVFVSYGPAVARSRPEEKLWLVKKLAGALDLAEEASLAGCTVVLGDRYGVDDTGKLWVDCAGPQEQMAASFGAVDLDEVSARRAAVQRKEEAERAAAEEMGVEMVYTEGSLAMGAEYASFLLRAREAAAGGRGKVGGGQLSSLPVRVVEGAGGGAEGGCRVDTQMGFVAIPMHATADEVWDFLHAKGPEAVRIRLHVQAEEARLAALKSEVRKALRLRHLARDEALCIDRFQACCARLLQHAPMLQPVTDGLPLKVAEAYGVAPDGSYISIAWDWEMSAN